MKVTEAPEALGFVPADIAMATDGATDALTPIVMLLLVAVEVVAQARFDVSTQDTTCAFVSVVVEKVELLVPAFRPPTFHW